MLNRACAVSLLAACSLIGTAGAASPDAATPKSLTESVSKAVAQGRWSSFLECFSPSARKSLMVALARPVFAAASADDTLESELARRMDSLGASKSMILSGTDLSRQARFVELLIGFADQHDIEVPTIFTNTRVLTLNADKTAASCNANTNGMPATFVLASQNGSFIFDLPAKDALGNNNINNASTRQAMNGSWTRTGLFPDFRAAHKAMKRTPTETPDQAWVAHAPTRPIDANPGDLALAYYPGDDGNNLHVCMLMGVSGGRATLLTTDGTLVSNIPGTLVTPVAAITRHAGNAPAQNDAVLAIRHDGGSFYGRFVGFENGAPVVSYFDNHAGRQARGQMDAVIPVNNGQCPMYQMVAFSCDGSVESGLCVAMYDGGVWVATDSGLESRSNEQVQLLAWSGTDTGRGVELFRPSTQNAMAYSGNFLPRGTNFEITLTPSLYPTPNYTVGGVDTDNDN